MADSNHRSEADVAAEVIAWMTKHDLVDSTSARKALEQLGVDQEHIDSAIRRLNGRGWDAPHLKREWVDRRTIRKDVKPEQRPANKQPVVKEREKRQAEDGTTLLRCPGAEGHLSTGHLKTSFLCDLIGPGCAALSVTTEHARTAKRALSR